MAYQINLTGKEIDERLQNVGTPADNPDANGTLFARLNKNVDDVDELRDAVGHIDTAQTETDKTVTQHTSNISTLQTAVSENKTKLNNHETSLSNFGQAMEEIVPVMGKMDASIKFATDPTNPVAVFKICNNLGNLCFAGDSLIDYTFKLFRHTDARYEEYPLWVDGDVDPYKKKKIPYTISVDTTNTNTFKPLNIQYEATTEPLGDFIKNHSLKKKWAIQAYVEGYTYTPLFEFAVSEQDVKPTKNLLGDSVYDIAYSLIKCNGARFIPQKSQMRLAYAYNSDLWSNVGDTPNGFEMFKDSSYPYPSNLFKIPVAGDIVRRSKNGVDGTVLYIDRKADGTFEMVWSEGKKVYTMVFSRYTYVDPTNNVTKRTGMRITKTATLVCDDITHQTKGGTLRDLYISAGAKYNEATGFYELNGLTDITEEEMRVIYEKTWGWWIGLPNLSGFGDSSARTNIPCPDYKRTYYQSNVNLSSSFATTGNLDKLEVLNFIPTQYPKDFSIKLSMRAMNWMCQGNAKPLTIMGTFEVGGVPDNNSLYIGGNIKTINIKNLSKNIKFYDSKVLSKESVLYMINNSAATSAITISLNKAVYDVMKDDADIIAALAEKTNITLVQNT